MSTIPASISEKRLIRQYANIYMEAKRVIDEWLENYLGKNQHQSILAQRVLLALTLVNLMDLACNKSNLRQLLDSILEKLKEDTYTPTYMLWSRVASLLVKDEKEAVDLLYKYFGVPPVPDHILSKVCTKLFSIEMDKEFTELLPYILEVFEYDNSDIKNAINDERRGLIPVKKKTKGIYYTPDDVADFIVNMTVGEYLRDVFNNVRELKVKKDELKYITILDPSCGTGIFLRKSLRILLKEFKFIFGLDECPLASIIRYNIYGVDKSPTAVDSCILVLLTSDLQLLVESKYAPISLWKIASYNIKCGDSVTGFLPLEFNDDLDILQKIQNLRNTIKEEALNLSYPKIIGLESNIQELIDEFNQKHMTYNSFHFPLNFPEVFLNNKNKGFSCVIGNPPYSNEYKIEDINSTQYVSCGDNLYTLFVENMIFLSSNSKSISGMVIPLSISYHTSRNYKKLRKLIEDDSATWSFFHFDRSPDSLFGDDIKTRNCILFRKLIDNTQKKLYTSSLARWNSRDRDKLFLNIPSIDISGFSIVDFIPKISSDIELHVINKIKKIRGSLFDLIKVIPKRQLSYENTGNNVYFYSTAYNWLPVFLQIPLSRNKNGETIISSSVWGGACSSKTDSLFVFGCTASKISYWLWVLRGDGFHFSSQVLKHLPYHPSYFSEGALKKLISLSNELWIQLLKHPISKVNSGKTICNYNFIACRSIIEEIDLLISKELALPLEFVEFINSWYLKMIQAGREDFKNAQFLLEV